MAQFDFFFFFQYHVLVEQLVTETQTAQQSLRQIYGEIYQKNPTTEIQLIIMLKVHYVEILIRSERLPNRCRNKQAVFVLMAE